MGKTGKYKINFGEETDMKEQAQARIITKSFVLLFLVSLVICTAMNMLNVIIPLYVTEDLGGTTAIAGFMATAYTAASCLSRPVHGMLADRLGRRTMMCLGTLVFGAACLVCGWLPVLAAAFICRIIMGVGYAAASTANNTASTDVIPPSRMAEGIGYFGISQSIASAIGPAVAAFVIAFVGNIGSLYGTAVLCFVAFTISLAVTYERKEGCASAPTGKKAGFVFEKTAVLPSVLEGSALFLISCVMCFMTLYIVGQGYSATVAGNFFLTSSMLIVAVRLALSRFVGKVPHCVFLVPAFASIIAMLLLAPLAQSAAGLYGLAVLFGIGHGTAWMVLGSEAVRNASPERRGAANAMFYFAFDAAIGLGASVWGVLIDRIGFHSCFRLAATGFALLAAASVFFYHRKN
jgi:predicted MFS family arabinose efflux permease